jgi:hypothetical protein
MKDLRHVFFNLGSEGLTTARTILERTGLASVAQLAPDGILAGSGSVTLPVDDRRLSLLIDELERIGEAPLVRAERTYTKQELDGFEWLNLRLRTPGLLGGFNLNQPYDRTAACPTCGAGARPISPLIADLRRMKKRLLDATSHDGHLVVAATLADVIQDAGLTGLEVQPVRSPRESQPDSSYRWLDITSEWGPMAPASVLKTDDLCPTCGRSGHYDEYGRATEFWYYEPPAEAADFNRTWEYFGVSHTYPSDRNPTAGGARMIIVSQRVRECFKQLKVRHVSFEPVWFLSRHVPQRAG